MSLSETQKRAQKNWISKVMTITVRIDPRKEPDVVQRLAEIENKSGYIKNLIRADIKNK